MAFPATPILDRWDRANAGPPPGPNWSTDAPALGQAGLSVVNQALVAPGPTSSMWWNRETFSPNMEAWFILGTSNPNFELYIRGKGAGTAAFRGYLVFYDPAAGGRLQLQRYEVGSGPFSNIGTTFAREMTAGQGIGFRAQGGLLEVYVSNDPLGQFGAAQPWWAIASARDTVYADGGQLAFISYASGTFGMFGGGSLPDTSAVAVPGRTTVNPSRAPANELGCGNYSASIWTRGGGTLVYDDLPVTNVQWARVLSDTSDASCDLVGIGLEPRCDSAIRETWPWQHELALSRDPGGVVWMGPVVKTSSKFTTGKIEARDLSAWWDRRNLPVTREYTLADLATIFNQLALDAELEDPFGLTVEATPTSVLASRIYRAGNYLLAGGQLRELTKAGIDWTLVAREALVGGIVVPADPIAFLQDSHIREAPTVDRDGLSAFANRVVTSGAGGGEQDNPIVGQAEDGASIAIYGLAVETANVDAIRDPVSAAAASQSRVDLVKTPAVILGDVTLSPTAPVLVSQLVPGAVVSCAFASSGIPVAGLFRLQKVQATGQGDAERIVVSLQPVGAGGDS